MQEIKNNSFTSACDFNQEINTDEIIKAIMTLSNGKSTSPDLIANEMLKNGTTVILKPLQ